MKIFKRLFFILLVSFGSQCTAQDWVNMMQNPNVNVHDVQKAFYEWYTTNKKDAKANTLKGEDAQIELFKRWENFMVPRTYPSGDRIDPVKLAADFEKYKSLTHNAQGATANWTYVGNDSVPVNGGGDGRVDRLRFFPGSSTIMYACTPSGGLWKSTNGGNSWATNTDNLGDLAISDIAFDPYNPKVMYIGTGDNDNPGSGTPTTIGVLKSTDGGNTWNATGLKYSLTYSGQYYMVVNQLLINPDSSNIIWAATSFGLWKSADSGATWKNILNQNIKSLEFEPSHSSVMYAGNFSGQFYRSADAGKTFKQVITGLPASGASRVSIGVSPADSNRVYVLMDNSSSGDFYGLYMSSDRGQTFNLQSSPSIGSPNILGYDNGGADTSGFGWYSLPIAISPTNADTMFAGGVNIWMSGDKGVTWSLNAQWYGSGAPYVHADQHHMVFSPGSSSTLYTTCDGGVFKTTDKGNSWINKSNNLEIGQLYSLGLSSYTPGLSISGWQDNGTNLSIPAWEQVYGGDGEDCFIDYSNDNNLFVSYQNGALYYSTDGGVTFNSATNGITETGPWTTRWLQDPQNSTVLYSGFMNVWESADMGVSWTPISSWGTSFITSIAVAPSNDAYIYAAQSDSIFLTKDGGTTWTKINGGLPFNVAYLTDIVVSPTDPLKAWVTFSGYSATAKVFETTNGGTFWKNLSTGLPNLSVNTIVYHPGSPDGVYVGTDMGVYYRDTILNKWVSYNTGLPNVVIDDLQIYSPGNTLVAGTFGRGVWQTSTYVAVGIDQLTLSSYINVFPNPTSGKVRIKVNMAKEGMYTIDVVNMLGQNVYHSKIAISANSVSEIDLSGYNKGVYFIGLTGNEGKMEKKIVLY